MGGVLQVCRPKRSGVPQVTEFSSRLSPTLPWNSSSPPLLLHFDVNKTLILTDSIDAKTQEDGIRETIAELFWGWSRREAQEWTWLGDPNTIHLQPPEVETIAGSELLTYYDFCRKVTKDKKELKAMARSFRLAGSENARMQMESLFYNVTRRMQLPEDVQKTKAAEDVGLRGTSIMMLPAVFVLTAELARSGRPFAVMFRSFGQDHEKIKEEWNGFCTMQHPLFSHLLDGIGPLDGTGLGPDRRLHNIHTLYRDSDGPVLALSTFTNGPEEMPWDQWARTKPRPEVDTRNGRAYFRDVLKAKALSGVQEVQKWFEDQLLQQSTAGIKDDWSWWYWQGQVSNAGKVFYEIRNTKQLFFDDNVELDDARIVDCRDLNGAPVPKEHALRHLIQKVSPVEAVIDDDYFLRALERCHGEKLGLQEWHNVLDSCSDEHCAIRSHEELVAAGRGAGCCWSCSSPVSACPPRR